MRRIWRGLGIAIGIGLFVPSCGDSDSPNGPGGSKGGSSGSGGAAGTAGSAGSSGQVGSGGAGSGGEGGTAGTMGSGAAGSAGDGSAGSAGDASVDGGAGDGDPGNDAEAGADGNPCAACSTGACVDGGVCVECTSSTHCPNARPICDVERNACVECLPSNDTCPSGQYCTAEKRCVKGCKDGSTCASGICTAAHDCSRCISDNECSGQKVCGSGVCGNACSTGGPPEQCGTGFTCCQPRCVRTDNDVSNCKVCGTACGDKQFCGKNGCTDATLRNVCNLGLVTAVLDTEANDAQAAATILQGLETRCAPAPTTRSIPEASAAEVLNPSTGRVVVPGGEMLVFAGGGFFQKGVGFLETQRDLPVYTAGMFPNLSFVKSADNTTIASTVYEEPGRHDIIVIQVGREESTGTLSLVAFGFHGNGTRAAAWYFVNVMLPDITNYPDAYYVYEWVDTNPNLNPDSGDTFTLEGSGN